MGGWDSQTCNLLSVNPDPDFRDLSSNCIDYGSGGYDAYGMVRDGELVMVESRTWIAYVQRDKYTDEYV